MQILCGHEKGQHYQILVKKITRHDAEPNFEGSDPSNPDCV